MSTTKLDQPQASATQLVPLLVPTEATTKHPTAALTEEYPTGLLRSIHPQNLKNPKQPLNFCPKCGMLLRTTTSAPATLRCKKCGYKTELEHTIAVDTSHSRKHPDEIAVIDQEKSNLRTYPIVQAICEKCGRTESETWTVATGSEGSVSAWVFLRCVHCGFTRREVG